MAGFIPGLLPTNHNQEKEFAQAYEDVLERYKVALLPVARIDKLHNLAQSKLKLRALSQGLRGFRGLLGETQD